MTCLGGKNSRQLTETLLVFVFAIQVLVALALVVLTRGRLGYTAAAKPGR